MSPHVIYPVQQSGEATIALPLKNLSEFNPTEARPTRRAPAGFAPVAIGLALFHLVAIPVSNASLNPARLTASALFGGAEAMQSL
jgi:glycerol uptake facilitator-like aquaporin